MSIAQRLGGAWRALAGGKAAPAEPRDAPGGMLSGIMPQGQPPRRGTRELLQSYGTMPWLRAACSRVSYRVAATPWKLLVVRPGKGERAIKYIKAQIGDPQSRRRAIKDARSQLEVEEITNHPMLDLLNNANPQMTGLNARRVTQAWLDIAGEGPWLLERDGLGTPFAYWPIPPHWVRRTASPGQPFYELGFGSWNINIPETEFVLFRDPDLENPYGRGSGMAAALSDELETDEYAAKHTKAWFYNRAVPPVLVSGDGIPPDQAKRLEEDWSRKNRGFWNAFKTYFLGAKVDVHQLSQTFDDMQLVELRKFERDTIIQVYGVPPEILGIVENSNRATIEAATLIFAEQVLEPRLELMREVMQVRLVPEYDERLILEYESPVPADREFELKAAQAAPHNLLMDDWRELAGRSPLPDGRGQVFVMPLMSVVVPLDELGEKPEEPEDEPEDQDEDDEGKTAAAKMVKVKDAGLSLTALYELLEALDEEHIGYRVHPKYKQIIEELGQQTMEQYGLGLSFHLQAPRVKYWLEHDAATMVRAINTTTRDALRATLAEGVNLGEGIPKLAKRISEVFAEAKGTRARTIARTETMRAGSFARAEALTQGGIPKKEWIATRDSRVRDTHAAADGQIVETAEKFMVGGYPADYPCDANLPPEESINCRCAMAGVIEDKTLLDTEEKRAAFWKAADLRVAAYERPFRTALVKGLQDQQNAVMDKLKELAAKEEE